MFPERNLYITYVHTRVKRKRRYNINFHNEIFITSTIDRNFFERGSP